MPHCHLGKTEMKYFIQKFLGCFYFGVFSYFIYLSIGKYLLGSTKYSPIVKTVDKVQYPSISVCPKFTFKEATATTELLSNNMSLDEKKSLALEKSWKKGEVFHFVSHPGIRGLNFPCVTLNDGTDPGKPCHFPIR